MNNVVIIWVNWCKNECFWQRIICGILNLFSAYLDLQYRSISYTARGTLRGPENIDIDEKYGFFNPKAGVVYSLNPKNKLYFSFARAYREPIRDDFEQGNPEPEELNDFELDQQKKC